MVATDAVTGDGTFRVIKGNLKVGGTIGRTVVPNVTGSRSDGAALADLLTELASMGLITDNSTA